MYNIYNIYTYNIYNIYVFIRNTSVNHNTSNLNARNTFQLLEKENPKYVLSSKYIRRINT